MDTCFIFARDISAEGALSLRLKSNGSMDAPLAWRSFIEIKKLQNKAKTMVIVPSHYFSFYRLQWPWLSEKKARLALPFALEELLAQDLNELHFAFDKAHYTQGHYLIVVGSKAYLTDLLSLLSAQELSLDVLTLDWFALDEGEALWLDSGFLLREEGSFNGFLAQELVSVYVQQLKAKNQAQPLIFKSQEAFSCPEILMESKALKSALPLWLAERLQNKVVLNLCQGPLNYSKDDAKNKLWYLGAFLMSLVFGASFFLSQGLLLHHLNQALQVQDKEIATIYREFFPGAKQIVSPRHRIQQFIAEKQGRGQLSFWILLNSLATALQGKGLSVDDIKFQGQVLQVKVKVANFNKLAELENSLQKQGIRVKQTQASSQEEDVNASLELSL